MVRGDPGGRSPPGMVLVRSCGNRMAARDPFTPGETVAGRYEIKERLGKGGFGTVFRAFHKDLGADVALKVLNPELAANDLARERFLAEVKATTAFVHKRSVQLRDFGHD